MERFIPDEIIDEIRSRSDIVDVVQSYLPLKRIGGRFKALCPFHNEKTPSFIVNQDRQIYHCFGCAKGGDVFRFVMDKEGVDFPNAAHILAARAGITIPERAYAGQDEKTRSESGKKRERLYKINEEMASWFLRNFQNNAVPSVCAYIASRNISPELLTRFRVGASPDSWDEGLKFCRNSGFSEEEYFEAGFAVKNEENKSIYDRFRNRMMFPIWDEQGRVVGFSGRTVEKEMDGAKYVNSPETPVFKKSKILYALPLARDSIKEKHFAILCEGQIDVIAMHSAGLSNAVAPQGTAFTDEQARILKRYTDKIYISFDSDEAGRKATLRTIEILLPLGFELKVVKFPAGKDPDDFLKQNGADAVKTTVDKSISFFDFVCDEVLKTVDMNSPWDRNKAVSAVLYYICKADSSVIRSNYAAKLAQLLKLPESAVFSELNKIKHTEVLGPNEMLVAGPSVSKTDSGTHNAEEILLELALSHGSVGMKLSEELPAEMISRTPVGKALDTVIAMTINGEWENATKFLLSQLCNEPDHILNRILANTSDINDERRDKAVSECIVSIKRTSLQREIQEMMNTMQNSSTEEEKNELRLLYTKKRKELMELSRKTAS